MIQISGSSTMPEAQVAQQVVLEGAAERSIVKEARRRQQTQQPQAVVEPALKVRLFQIRQKFQAMPKAPSEGS
jgi:hypothetical protein